MKTKILVFFTITFLVFNFSSCKKEDKEPTKTDLLTKKEWQFYKSETYDLDNQFLGNELVDPLYFDFKTDHQLIITDPQDPEDAEIMEWDFNNDKTKIYFIYPDNNIGESYIIEKLEDQEMILKEDIYYPVKRKAPTYDKLYFKR